MKHKYIDIYQKRERIEQQQTISAFFFPTLTRNSEDQSCSAPKLIFLLNLLMLPITGMTTVRPDLSIFEWAVEWKMKQQTKTKRNTKHHLTSSS
jgi:hypothetical protein